MLSVCLPNYNHAHFLITRIPQILAAMPINSELIILDDGSTDNSLEIIHKFSEDKRVKVIALKKNTGVVLGMNQLLQEAQGELISFVSSDDVLFPSFYTELLNAYSKYPDYGVYTSNFASKKGNNDLYSQELISNCQTITPIGKDEIVSVLRKTDFWIPMHCSLFSTKALQTLPPFEKKLHKSSDWLIAHLCALSYGVVHVPKTLAYINIRKNSFSNISDKIQKKNELDVMEYVAKTLPITCTTKIYSSTILRMLRSHSIIFYILRPKYWRYLYYQGVRFLEKKFGACK